MIRIRVTVLDDLPVLQDIGRAAGEDDVPVACLIASRVDGNLHVEQVSVHPGSARRGIGRSLLDHLAARAAGEGVPALTLTTFAGVPLDRWPRVCMSRSLITSGIS